MKRLTMLALVCIASVAFADEGMWTLDNFPSQMVMEKYGVEIDDAWLERVQKASVRLEGGCSGSFVSPEGLILTNHHCVRGCLTQMSSAENDIEANGFLADEPADEVRCEATQVSVLTKIEEITDQVAAATEGMDDVEANEARKQTLTRLEKQCKEASNGNLACEAVTLYHGGQYFLYGYKRYDDVRMVFVPEADIASFGGDPDNFNFPRWNLDMSLMRAYEDGEPADTPHHLPIRAAGPDEGEPVFISGQPGGTSRLLSVAELEYNRNVVLPHWLARYFEYRGRLIQYSKTGDEPLRIAQAPIMGIENGLKVQRHRLQALMDGGLMEQKMEEEQALIAAVAADPELQRKYGSAWDEVSTALDAYLPFRDEYLFIEQDSGFYSSLFDYAKKLVRGAAERQKPNEERYREFTDAALPGLEQRLLAARPIYPDYETLKLSYSLDKMREYLGPDHAFVRQVLGSDSPDTLAQRLIDGTKLADPEVRRQLWEGGEEAVAASDDPMIQLALSIDAQARELRDRYETEVEASWKEANERLAQVRFATMGTERYPDATFTLRVSFGTVQGWDEKGEEVYPFTTVPRLFERATGSPPFELPPSWIEAEDQLDPETRFNLVTTTDVIGGNSGSPLIDAEGRLVGLVFDGNIHAIGGNYWFDEAKNRTVSVHPAIIIEALTKIYKAERLLAELATQ